MENINPGLNEFSCYYMVDVTAWYGTTTSCEHSTVTLHVQLYPNYNVQYFHSIQMDFALSLVYIIISQSSAKFMRIMEIRD